MGTYLSAHRSAIFASYFGAYLGPNEPTNRSTIFATIIGAYMGSYKPTYRSSYLGSN